MDLLAGSPLCCSEIPGCWAKVGTKPLLPTHRQALEACMSFPTPALTSDWVIFYQKLIQSCPTTSNTNHQGSSGCLQSMGWGWGVFCVRVQGSFRGSVLPTVTGTHSHLLTKAPWTLDLPLATGIFVPSTFLALTTQFGCFWPLGSPGTIMVESL